MKCTPSGPHNYYYNLYPSKYAKVGCAPRRKDFSMRPESYDEDFMETPMCNSISFENATATDIDPICINFDPDQLNEVTNEDEVSRQGRQNDEDL